MSNRIMFLVVACALQGCSSPSSDSSGTTDQTSEMRSPRSSFNRKGDVLISDQFNNRVIEITPEGKIVWTFGLGPNDVSKHSIIGVNDAQRVGTLTLMAGTGAPAGTEPLCPSGCPDNRVLLVDKDGEVVWQYGRFGITGAKHDELNSPVQCTWLPSSHVLITDQGNERIIEVTLHKHIVWQYGKTGVIGSGFNELNNPNSAELLENGHILISDESNNRAIEVRRDHSIAATFTAGGTVNGVAFASRLANGHTLMTDSGNNRIVEVDEFDAIVWQFATNARNGSNPNPAPTRAVRLRNGHTLISDQFNHQVIEIDTSGNVLRSYGNINVPGFGTHDTSQGLNAPYDAKVVGDYTGLTPPFDKDDDDSCGDHP